MENRNPRSPRLGPRQVLVVTGMSGAGKSSVLRALEDVGFETIDNPPFDVFPGLAARGTAPLAIGLDVRSDGFDAARLAKLAARSREPGAIPLELVYVEADKNALLRRFTETRRRHPLAGADGGVGLQEAIEAEKQQLLALRGVADFIIDTSGLSLPELRKLVAARYGGAERGKLALTVMSFAYPRGLPQEADMVFDMRWLRNPHYLETLRPKTGLDEAVARYVFEDPHFSAFYNRLREMLMALLPRFTEEGKHYLTIALGCTGGRHRSVAVAHQLAGMLNQLTESEKTALGVGSVREVHRELAPGAS